MRRGIPYVLAVLLIVVGIGELGEYGLTWDECLGELFFGERYFSYFTTFDHAYLDFAANPYPPQRVPYLGDAQFRSMPQLHWPVSSTLANATSALLSRVIPILDPFEGFHAINLLLAAVLLVVFYRFVERETSSPWTAVLAIGLLFLMPRMVADLFTNIKDFPEMVFFSLALLVFHHAYERRSAGAIIASGAIWGLALGTKANALFLPPIVALFVLWRWLGNKSERQGRVLLAIAIAFVAGLAVLVISWPYLWAAPFSRMLENLQYVAVRGRGGTAAQNLAPWLSMVFYTTPLAVLLLFAIGLPSTIVRAWRGRSADQFLLVWLVVIVGRLSVPGAINFDGVRHFLELFPPIAAIAAIGGMESIRRVSAHPAFRATIASVVLLTTAFATWASHPFEIAYFNAFIGGLRGAQARGVPQATDYWGSSYRHGIGWMNENAPDGSALVVTIGSHMVRLGAQVWLKPGVTVLSGERATVEQAKTLARERPVYVMFITRNEWRTPIDRDAERRLRPVRVWSLDGAPILKLYRYTP